MKQIQGLLTLMAVVSGVPVANAATTAWYTTTDNGLGVPAGGEGQVLSLWCLTSGPPIECTYNVTMHVNGDDTVGLVAWASNLHSTSSSDSITNVAIAPGNPFDSVAQPGTGGSGANLLAGSQGQTFGAPVTGAFSLISFTLHHVVSIPGQPPISHITEQAGDGSGGVVWEGGDLDYAVVSFAGGPAHPHAELDIGGLVIDFPVIPEPAAIGMLGIGAMALVRLRRRPLL